MTNSSEKTIDAAAPTEQAEIDALKRYGWSDEEISSMTPAQRREEFHDAMASGQSEPPKAATSESDVPNFSHKNDVAAPGTRDEPIKATTQQDVLDAQPAEPTIRVKDAREAAAAAAPGPPKSDEPAAPAEPQEGGSPIEPLPQGGGSAAEAVPSTEQAEIDALKRYGWDNEDIGQMSRSTRQEIIRQEQAKEQGEPTAELALRRGNPSKPVENTPRTRLTKSLSGKLFYGGLSVIFFFAIFRVIFERQEEIPQIVAGWDGISQCAFTSSFDGKKHLSLSENHFARIEGPDQASVDGSWSFDESSSKYTITVNSDPVTYAVVTPGDGANCMLIKGDPGTADLPQSWFYSRADLEDQTDT